MRKPFFGFVAAATLTFSVLYDAKPANAQAAPAAPQTEVRKRDCPKIPLPLDAGHKPMTFARPGATVPPEGLDEKPRWAGCEMPVMPAGLRGVARLAITVDEDGKVTDVKPRGAPASQQLFDIVARSARGWKVIPPRANGVAVKTVFSVDFVFRD